MPGTQNIRRAARILLGGGVIAYPTEGVFGLGCLPEDYSAVSRILTLKKRSIDKGLIVIASQMEQLAAWVNLPNPDLGTSSQKPVTWIVPATDAVPAWVRGSHDSVAVRLTTHSVARKLCDLTKSCLISTSANLAGHNPARNAYVLRRQFGTKVDYIVPGQCGPATGASEIRNLITGKTLRPA